jgi:uncharacterized protein YjbI with pentapeptide repeats
MANKDQLKILRRGVEAWNKWREENSKDRVDLREVNLEGADLFQANLGGADLRIANLNEADLNEANLRGSNLYKAHLNAAYLRKADLRETFLSRAYLRNADLSEANLSGAYLSEASLIETKLSKADLSGTDLSRTCLYRADLSKANLSRANLRGSYLNRAILVKTNLRNAILTDCGIYGISAWGLNLEGAEQKNLAITPLPTITVDNLEVAQFLYLLLYSKKVREAINTVASKVVLILGRFTPDQFMPERWVERRIVLDALREELRGRGYIPVLFPFREPHFEDSNLEDSFLEDHLILDPIETISTLAHMARFLIADITDAKGLLSELESIVPELSSVPVMPIVPHADYEDGLLEQIRRYPWVLEPYRYENQAELIRAIGEKVITPAEIKVRECRPV